MPRTFVWHRTRGPKTTAPNTLTSGQVLIEQVRSGIGQTARMRANLAALGLRHHQDVVVKTDSPSVRGQILRVRHLVTVTAVSETVAKAAASAGTAQAEKSLAAKVEKSDKARKVAKAANAVKAAKLAGNEKTEKAEKADRKEK